MEWHVAVGSQQYVARSLEEVAGWIRERRIGGNALVYDPRIARWVSAQQVPELRSLFARPAKPACSSPLAAGCLILLGFAFVISIVFNRETRTPSSAPAPAATPAPNSADYAAGYARGESEGFDHAKSGAGMPIPLGMNWMADNFAQGAHPSDPESWKRGFKDGFAAGFNRVKPFHRNEAEWEQLSWRNARAGTKLYDHDGTHKATITRVDRGAGLITVRYVGGDVERKDLDAVSPYWWVRR